MSIQNHMPTNVHIWGSPVCQDVEFVHARTLTAPVPRQVSSACKLVYFERGARRFLYRGHRLTAGEGSLLLIPPGEVHGADAPDNPETSLRILSLPAGAFAKNAAAEGTPGSATQSFFCLFITHPTILAAFRLMHRTSDRFASVLEQQTLFTQLLDNLRALAGIENETLGKSAQENRPIRRTREYLDARYTEGVTLEQLAQIAELAPAYLCRVFTKEVGMPPHAYQTSLRIMRSRALLGQGHSIGTVAQELGFYDHSHFIRHFRRFVHMTPAEYVRQVKNVQDRKSSRCYYPLQPNLDGYT